MQTFNKLVAYHKTSHTVTLSYSMFTQLEMSEGACFCTKATFTWPSMCIRSDDHTSLSSCYWSTQTYLYL